MKIKLIYEFHDTEFEYEVDVTMDLVDPYGYYYDEAYEAYLEAKEMEKDIYAYHGVSRWDF